jgi:hypothetical protein
MLSVPSLLEQQHLTFDQTMAQSPKANELPGVLTETDQLSNTNRSYVDGKDSDIVPRSDKQFGQVQEHGSDQGSSSEPVKEVFDIKQIDPVLAKKLALVNQAIDDIGMTSFQWKLFFLNGFGYAVDSVSRAIPSLPGTKFIGSWLIHYSS